MANPQAVSMPTKAQYAKVQSTLAKLGVNTPTSNVLPAYANLIGYALAPSTHSQASKVAQHYASTMHNATIGASANINPTGMASQHLSGTGSGCRCVYCYWQRPKKNYPQGSWVGRFGTQVALHCAAHKYTTNSTQRPRQCTNTCTFAVIVLATKQLVHTMLASTGKGSQQPTVPNTQLQGPALPTA